jgi:hypothetical protein
MGVRVAAWRLSSKLLAALLASAHLWPDKALFNSTCSGRALIDQWHLRLVDQPLVVCLVLDTKESE